VLISSIRLSDRRHRTTHGGRPLCARIRCGTASSPNTCCAHYPDGSNGCLCRLLPPFTRPSPHFGRVGIRIMDFEACSGFTRVTARWIARPPEAVFVTRLQPVRLPVQAARQLPDQSTTLWTEPSSAGDTRLQGAPKRTQFSGWRSLLTTQRGGRITVSSREVATR
jgi:hypothetical protein